MHTGLAEFNVAMTHCRPRYLALHDAQTFKHYFSLKELQKKGSGYEEVEVGYDVGGVGHAIFKRVE